MLYKMKTVQHLLLYVLAFAVFSSCSKEGEPTASYVDTPAFYLKGQIGLDSLDIVVGEDDFTLVTDYIAGPDSVLILRGRVEHISPSEHEAFAIWFRTNSKVNIGTSVSPINITQELQQQLYSLSSTGSYSVLPGEYLITAFASGNATNFSWSSGNGSNAGNQSTFSVQNQVAEFPITLVGEGNSCVDQITHHINLSKQCDISFDLTRMGDSVLKPTIKTRSSGSPVSTEWFLDDQKIEISNFGTFKIDTSIPHISCKAVFTFADGCEKTVIRTIRNDNIGTLQSCNIDFDYIVQHITQPNPQQFGTVELIYTDSNGVRYTSKHEDFGGSFSVQSVSDFQRNERDMPTKRFSFTANAVLKSANGDELVLKELFGHFAVAYPD
jgi:hypothetical protein